MWRNANLNDVLMNPGDGTSSDPVLSRSKESVNLWFHGDSSVVGIMLNIQA
jgi:hypothetical protein